MNVVTAPKPEIALNWAKPELVRLGQIADVAGAPSGVTQNASKS